MNEDDGDEDPTAPPVQLNARPLLELAAAELCHSLHDVSERRLRTLGKSARGALLAATVAAKTVDAARVRCLCPGLEAVALVGAGVSEGCVVALARECGSQLRSLSLDGAVAVRDSGMAAAAQAFPNLTRLSLENCRVTDRGLCAVGASCAALCELNAAWNGANISDLGVCAVAAGCPRLTLVDVSGSSVSDRGLSILAAGCPGLRRIGLRQCERVSEAGLRAALGACAQLESAELCVCPTVGELTVAQLVIGCVRLRAVDASMCHSLSDGALALLVAGLPALHRVDAFGAAGLRAPTVTSASLAELSLSGCRALAEPTFKCQGLRTLQLRNCRALTDESVERLLSGCPALACLDLIGCVLLAHLRCDLAAKPADAVIARLESRGLADGAPGASGSPGGMREDGSGRERPPADSAVGAASGQWAHAAGVRERPLALQTLLLGGCVRLTALRLSCARLRTLSLLGCIRLDDSALGEALRRTPALRLLDVSGCVALCEPQVRCARLHSLSARIDGICPQRPSVPADAAPPRRELGDSGSGGRSALPAPLPPSCHSSGSSRRLSSDGVGSVAGSPRGPSVVAGTPPSAAASHPRRVYCLSRGLRSLAVAAGPPDGKLGERLAALVACLPLLERLHLWNETGGAAGGGGDGGGGGEVVDGDGGQGEGEGPSSARAPVPDPGARFHLLLEPPSRAGSPAAQDAEDLAGVGGFVGAREGNRRCPGEEGAGRQKRTRTGGPAGQERGWEGSVGSRALPLRPPCPAPRAPLAALSLAGCRGLGAACFESLSPALGAAAPGLASLDLSRCLGLLDCHLPPLLAALRSLRHLNLSRSSGLIRPLLRSHSLANLDLSGCEALLEPSVTAPRLSSLCLAATDRLRHPRLLHCTGLRQLLLDGCGPLVALELVGAASLLVLSLSRCDVGGAALAAAVRSAPCLQTLDLSGCRTLEELVLSAPVLRMLTATWCAMLASINVCACPELRTLKAHGCVALLAVAVSPRKCALRTAELNRCRALTDGALGTLAARAPGLRSLTLSGCTALVAPSLDAPQLESLQCQAAGALRTLSLYAPELRTLVANGCAALEQVLLRTEPASGPSRTTLPDTRLATDPASRVGSGEAPRRPSGAGRVAVSSRLTASPACPALASVQLGGCARLADEPLRAMLRSCPGLAVCELRGCALLSAQAVAESAEHCQRAAERLAGETSAI
ncbi:hypothetical protein T492DRAFT_907094 [Pavlovales sp. CCMP2436]|nr:hypothetical protein T492DRAFT_907094 [Pavlovales sp. CCMP2436]